MLQHPLINRLTASFIGIVLLGLSFFFFSQNWPWFPNPVVHARGSFSGIENSYAGRYIGSMNIFFRLTGEDMLFRISGTGLNFEENAHKANVIELTCAKTAETRARIFYEDNTYAPAEDAICTVIDISFDNNPSYMLRLYSTIAVVMAAGIFAAGSGCIWFTLMGPPKSQRQKRRPKKTQNPPGTSLRSRLQDQVLAEKRVQRRQAQLKEETAPQDGSEAFLWIKSQIDLPGLGDQDQAYGVGISPLRPSSEYLHTIALKHHNEIRFGPPVFHLEIDRRPVSRKREFIDNIAWTADGKYLAVLEIMTSRQHVRSGTMTTVFNLENNTFCCAPIPDSERSSFLDRNHRGEICYRRITETGKEVHTSLNISALGPWQKIEFE